MGILKNLLLLIAAMIVGFKAYELAWPFVDAEGVVREGSYRGLKIGDTKAEVVSKLNRWSEKLKFDGYFVSGDMILIPTVNPNSDDIPPLRKSNRWLLTYPNIHKETIQLYFDKDRIASIKYRRDAFAP